MLQGQDWKPVILQKPKSTAQSYPKNNTTHFVAVKDVDAENNPILKVSPKLCTAFVNARVSAKMSHEQLAHKLSVPIQYIKSLESGKLEGKHAKQIALKLERALRVKIL